jgi:Tfp pilus assembly protein PilX
MRKLKRFFAREDGIAMATVIAMTTVLTLLSIVLIDQVTAETNNAGAAATADSVYQAAEAGANDYIAKLTDDPQYYDHYVAKGEATRQGADGTTVAHSTSTVNNTWPSGLTWTYQNQKDWWYAGIGGSSGNTTSLRGFAYDLMITPPSEALGTNYIDIVSTGCRVLDMNATPLQCDSRVPMRSVELHVRRSTPADFQYMVDYDPTKYDPVCYGSTLYGKVYSTQDICFNSTGVSYGNLMAEGSVTGISADRLRNGARIYDSTHPDIRTVVPNPITFASLGDPSIDIKRSAANNVPSTDFEDATNAKAWRINFTSDGNVQVWKCTFASGSPDPASSQPYCNDVKLTANVTLKKSTSATIYVNESTASFPTSGTIYVGVGSGRTDTVTYTGTTSTLTSGTFTGALCNACGSSGITHNSGEVVSIKSGGIGWATPYFNQPIPSNGAIYTGQDAIISWPSTINGYSSPSQDGSQTSKVNGRVTVASGGDIMIGGDIHYASEPASDGIGGPDDDVLGLIAKGNIWLPKYAPPNLWWRAATMAMTGICSDYNCTNVGPDRGPTSSMTFVGTSAYTNPTGCIQYYDGAYHGYRIVNVSRIADDGSAGAANSAYAKYDALKFLFPPWFPVINGMETTVLFREVPASFIPPAVPTG